MKTLAAKLGTLGAVLLLLALGSVGLTLWITWQTEGGAAAVNEAGRLRMQTWRLAQAVTNARDAATEAASARAGPAAPAAATASMPDLPALARQFDASLALLATGDPARPLFTPRDAATQAAFERVRVQWHALRAAWLVPAPAITSSGVELAAMATALVDDIDAFVHAIESQLARRTAVLSAVQLGLMGLAIASSVAVMYASQLFIFGPLARLHGAMQRLQRGEREVRVAPDGNDEFGRLADGFNAMAATLQGFWRELEQRVQDKTETLRAERERLGVLYEASAFVARAATLDELARGFATRLREAGAADGVLLRWYDAAARRHLLLASSGVPEALCRTEQGLAVGHCHCGHAPEADGAARVIPIMATGVSGPRACREHGFGLVVTVPVRLHDQLLGEADMLYRDEQHALAEADRALLESLGAHLASGIESLRAQALEREAAAADERTALARELHDSIAQGLAFLKIQLQLLRGALRRNDAPAVARAVDELDTGIRDSGADVRELLLHFRTRTADGDFVAALQSTLQKFQHQSGVRALLVMEGSGVPPPADVQLQLLHVVQEALSNVRKHARAHEVRLLVQPAAGWRIEVVDDGCGFEPGAAAHDTTHVGLAIMRERAAAAGAEVRVDSRPGQGTRVVLALVPAPSDARAEAVTA